MFFFKYIKHIFTMMDKYFKVSIFFSLKATLSSFKKKKDVILSLSIWLTLLSYMLYHWF